MMAVIEQHAGAMEGYLSTVSPGPCVPWRDASFAVLGPEVTGPDPEYDEIGRVAGVPVECGRALIGAASETTLCSKTGSIAIAGPLGKTWHGGGTASISMEGEQHRSHR
jgi:hypothetical protein